MENEEFLKRILSDFHNLDNLMGAIVIKNKGETLVGIKYWNYVANLWASISYGIEEYINTGEATILFPNNPLQFTLKREHSTCKFGFVNRKDHSILNKQWILPEKEFISTLFLQGLHFFEKITKYNRHDRAYHEV